MFYRVNRKNASVFAIFSDACTFFACGLALGGTHAIAKPQAVKRLTPPPRRD